MPTPPPITHQPGYAYRPALDGVRALAVAGVLLFHGGIAALPGGFLGVDAFFVLSGFLITSLLLGEYQRSGRIRLGAFWLRRARRLLPALLLVITATVVVYRGVLAEVELALLRGDALATLAYAANWRMIYRGDDYFTQTAGPSPLQHAWSLGIEEQFYLIWPLLVVGLIALGLRRRRELLAAVCLTGAAASAVAGALLYQPLDVNRAYFGTDTRAQALLIGAALAALLFRPARAGDWSRPVVLTAAVLGGLGVVGVGWIWATADGDDAWLYRGGLTATALAVAAIIAHAVLSPTAVIARVLAWPPLVLLGRISYGVYLWHWPLYGLLNAQQTGLHGTALLALRLVATLALAGLSYWLVEQPIRTGQRPWPLRPAAVATGSAGTPRRPALAWAASAVAFGVAAVVVVGGTAPPAQGALTPVFSLPTAPTPAVSGRPDGSATPIQRPGRRPGEQPRIAFFGDSVSWSLGTYLPPQRDLAITVRSIQGCGIARLPDLLQLGDGGTNYPGCPEWDTRWRKAVDLDDPDVAVILLDRWELMDRRIDGVYRHVGDPVYDAYLESELELAISIVTARGAHVALLTAPYTRRAERYDGSLYDEDLPERVEAWNRLLYQAQARHPQQVSIIDLNARVCPEGEFTWTVNGGLQIRSDGLHFTVEGVRAWVAPWLLPKLAALALGAPMPGGSS